MCFPTYNEADNLEPIAAAILSALPDATLLIVDDGSPDGTGQIADRLAAADARVRVLHRAAKAGLGRAYLAGFRVHSTAVRPPFSDGRRLVARSRVAAGLLAPIADGSADLVIGSRYAPGGACGLGARGAA